MPLINGIKSIVYTDLESSPRDSITWKKEGYKICFPISVKKKIENTHTRIYDYLYIDDFWKDSQEAINSSCFWAGRSRFLLFIL